MMLVVFVVGVLSLLYYYYLIKIRKYKSLFEVPGPSGNFLLGNALDFRSSEDILPNFISYLKQYGTVFAVRIGFDTPFLMFCDPQSAEFLLSNPKILNKSLGYTFLHNWLGTGLLTAPGRKWKKHRKVITPAFHFKILENFVDVFNSAGDILVKQLNKEVGKNSFDIYPFLSLYALDVISECAMGVNLNAQEYPQSDYVRAVKDMCRIIVERSISATKRFWILYRFSEDYKIEQKALKILHTLSNSIIKSRKTEIGSNEEPIPTDEYGKRKRCRPLLDILLMESKKEEAPLTDEELRQEVDTFMFAVICGHDTTSTAMGYILYCLAGYPEVQKRVIEELNNIFSDDPERTLAFRDLQKMVYMEQVIKETLRLYPSVPIYSRHLTEDAEYGGYKLPEGTEIGIFAYAIHRDPKIWPDPESFKPERFAETNNRPSFSFLPFCAGPRNCIGQKFAMLEMKATVSILLRNFEILPATPIHIVKPVSETVLKSKNGVCVSLRERK